MQTSATGACSLIAECSLYYAKTMQTSATGACSLIAECSLYYAKTMQTSATGACSLIAECSLSYAKIYIIISPAKRFARKAYARPCRTGRLAGQYGPFGGAIRPVSGCKTAPMGNTLATNHLAASIFFRYDMATGIAGGPDCNMPRQPPAQNGSGGTQPSQVVSHRPVCHSPKPAGSVTSRPPAA